MFDELADKHGVEKIKTIGDGHEVEIKGKGRMQVFHLIGAG
jgi:hypothetical protein